MEIKEPTNWQVRQTELEINLKQVEKNLRTIHKYAASAGIVVLLKSNAYGHSLVHFAEFLDNLPSETGFHGFAVANVEEGIELRRHKVRSRIYVLSGVQSPCHDLYRCLITCDLLPVIPSLRVLREFANMSHDFSQPLRLHLKFNTGMNRLGIDLDQVSDTIAIIKKHPNLLVEGLLSHYADAEHPRSKSTKVQTKRFRSIVHAFKSHALPVEFIHMANSFGVQNHCFPEGNLVRVGLHLYGEGWNLVEPVAHWSAQVYDVREVKKGEGIGYGPLYYTKKKSKIAILGVGYGDGYPRALSNKAEVLIQGKRCKVIGAISMDLTSVDVSTVENARPGMRATLLGKDRNDRITAVELAKRANCIPWEILTGISARVPRIFRRESNKPS